MELWEFYYEVGKKMADNPEWRHGQAMYNVLAEVRPDLKDKIRKGDGPDPFHYQNGEKMMLTEFDKWLDENW